MVAVAARNPTQAQRLEEQAERWRAEAARLKEENKSLRAEVKSLNSKVARLEGKVAALAERVAELARLAFGKRSEKHKTPEPAGEGGGAGRGSEGAKRRRGQQPGSKGHGRRDYSHIETEEVIHDLEEGERVCPHCGVPYDAFDEESSEAIDWLVRIVRIVHRRRRYRRACRCRGHGVLVAPVPPKPIAKGRFTSGFLARLLHEKYVLGRPLERIVAALGAEGLAVPKGTLVGQLAKLAELLRPLDQAIRAQNASSAHLHMDETTWRVFEEVEGKDSNRWWCWVFLGPDTSVFVIDPTRSAQVVSSHLGIDIHAESLQEGRHLLVSSDFYAVYQSLAQIDGVEALWCWAHIRRLFVKVRDAHPWLAAWAEAWLCRIKNLYLAHRALRGTEASGAEANSAEEAFHEAIGKIDEARRAEMADEGLSAVAMEVLEKIEREWEGLARHGEYPELDIDNNAAERALRNPVVQRKCYSGSGSKWAAELAASVWTITATAALAGANPLLYLRDYLDACAKAGAKAPSDKALEAFFPWSASEADLDRWRLQDKGPSP